MQKLKRILALAGVVLLVGMYGITLVLGLTASGDTKGMLMASIACTVIVPCLFYAFMLVAKVLDGRGTDTEETCSDMRKDGKKDD